MSSRVLSFELSRLCIGNPTNCIVEIPPLPLENTLERPNQPLLFYYLYLYYRLYINVVKAAVPLDESFSFNLPREKLVGIGPVIYK
jgi:hypothetical protein